MRKKRLTEVFVVREADDDDEMLRLKIQKKMDKLGSGSEVSGKTLVEYFELAQEALDDIRKHGKAGASGSLPLLGRSLLELDYLLHNMSWKVEDVQGFKQVKTALDRVRDPWYDADKDKNYDHVDDESHLQAVQKFLDLKNRLPKELDPDAEYKDPFDDGGDERGN